MKNKSTIQEAEAASLWNIVVKAAIKAVNGEYTDAQYQEFKDRLDAIVAKHAAPNIKNQVPNAATEQGSRVCSD